MTSPPVGLFQQFSLMSRFAVPVLLVGMTNSTITNGVRRTLQGNVLHIILGQI